MSASDDKSLYLRPFDHRQPYVIDVFNFEPPLTGPHRASPRLTVLTRTITRPFVKKNSSRIMGHDIPLLTVHADYGGRDVFGANVRFG